MGLSAQQKDWWQNPTAAGRLAWPSLGDRIARQSLCSQAGRSLGWPRALTSINTPVNSHRALDKLPTGAGERLADVQCWCGWTLVAHRSRQPPQRAHWVGLQACWGLTFLSPPRRDTSGAPWGGQLSSWVLAFSCLWPSGTQSHGESVGSALIQDLRAVGWWSGVRAPTSLHPETWVMFFLPRHLQRFWGASGYFWQAQWERLLFTFEGKEWILYILSEPPRPLALRGGAHDCSFPPVLLSCSLLWDSPEHSYKE